MEVQGSFPVFAVGSGGTRVALPGSLEPGTWTFSARFSEDNASEFATKTLGAGESWLVTCSTRMLKCGIEQK